MFIDDNGIEKIRGAFYDVEEIETPQSIISLDEAITILKDNIDMINFHNGLCNAKFICNANVMAYVMGHVISES